MKKKIFIWLDDERPIRAIAPKAIGYPEICDIIAVPNELNKQVYGDIYLFTG